MFRMPPATQALILSCVIVYFAQTAVGLDAFALWPIGSGEFLPWQLLSYSFLHGGLSHLVFNMFGLYMFGAELERVWGARRLLVFYFVSVLCAALAQLGVAALSGSMVPTIGASGGLFGLLLGFAMLFPHRKIVPLIPPIPMPAWLFVLLYGLVELGLGVTGSLNGVAHFAHLGGIAGGWLTLRYWRGQPPFGWGRR
ncbi:rhomboid family intramembrane serine protease [Variovorax sp. J22G21]|uniref:rhomboid family intramembrane serine protease n=2 Tax=Variovorax fucosicus TaxID=3053517 RepID=UPI002576425A|nr:MULTISPECIES: rhomboid family intramembrane serine protease [unclassified Variovorax]MDM0041698.1 rhomboid family intramembrane serine protease [Variovorax sp. J22R193]MDM0060754.1 rhomboid family intramembrane serine protease [Variovorax sp. J22G21]